PEGVSAAHGLPSRSWLAPEKGNPITEAPADVLAGASAMGRLVGFSYPLRASRGFPHASAPASSASPAKTASVAAGDARLSSRAQGTSGRPTALPSNWSPWLLPGVSGIERSRAFGPPETPAAVHARSAKGVGAANQDVRASPAGRVTEVSPG